MERGFYPIGIEGVKSEMVRVDILSGESVS